MFLSSLLFINLTAAATGGGDRMFTTMMFRELHVFNKVHFSQAQKNTFFCCCWYMAQGLGRV